jgi:hypothetical protein
MNMTKEYKASKLSGRDIQSSSASPELKHSLHLKFSKDYFGLPPYTVVQSPEALAYKSRAPMDSKRYYIYEDQASTHDVIDEGGGVEGFVMSISEEVEVNDTNYSAQRKVARALLKMVSSNMMIKHFLSKGGLDAVLKLISESKDMEVLQSCAACLMQSSVDPSNVRLLLDKMIFASLQQLIEVPEDALMGMKHSVVRILANLSVAPGLEEVLVQYGMLSLLQSLNSNLHRPDSMCYLLLALSNLSPAISSSETSEQVVRMCFLVTQKLDVMKHLSR